MIDLNITVKTMRRVLIDPAYPFAVKLMKKEKKGWFDIMEKKEKIGQQEAACQSGGNQYVINRNGCEVTVRFSQDKNTLAQKRVLDILTQAYLNKLCKI
jgi:hypothetical protein